MVLFTDEKPIATFLKVSPSNPWCQNHPRPLLKMQLQGPTVRDCILVGAGLGPGVNTFHKHPRQLECPPKFEDHQSKRYNMKVTSAFSSASTVFGSGYVCIPKCLQVPGRKYKGVKWFHRGGRKSKAHGPGDVRPA